MTWQSMSFMCLLTLSSTTLAQFACKTYAFLLQVVCNALMSHK